MSSTSSKSIDEKQSHDDTAEEETASQPSSASKVRKCVQDVKESTNAEDNM
jgi:hypothetical protein